MKPYVIIAAVLLVFVSCSTQQKTTGKAGLKETLTTDSTEYSIIILDPGFDLWYQIHYVPALDRDNQVYRSYNKIGVMNWNDYFVRGKFRNIIEEHLNYNYNIDYGIDVNRKLYWYFKYIEGKYKIRLFE